MRRLTYRHPRPATAARDQAALVAAGFLRAAVEADGHGIRLTCWTRSPADDRLVRGLLGEPHATGQELLDRRALDAWRVRLAPGCWLLGQTVPPPRSSRTIVRMPVGSGFGLGDHPTTILAAGLVARAGATGKRVLDLGCGSGVLAALAGRLGASLVHAVDLDADSVTHARRTLRTNQVESRVWTSNLLRRVTGTYDLVAANLVGDLLGDLFASGDLHRVVATGGEVIVSGISDARRPAVAAAARADGWRIRGHRHAHGWWGLRLGRQGKPAGPPDHPRRGS